MTTDDDWTHKFLAVLAEGSTVEIAARACGKDRSTCYRRRQADKEFAEAWDTAIESGTDLIEQRLIERAMNYSDQLILALMKARRPDVWKERHSVEHSRVDFSEARAELERMATKLLTSKDDEGTE